MRGLIVQQRRGGLVETVHPVSACVVQGDRLLWSVGALEGTFWRSSSKPLQLLVSLEHLPAEVVEAMADEDLAIGAASHSGQAAHTARVEALLGRFGLAPEQLRCGGHWPSHDGTKKTMIAAGERYSRLHSNCSGKHAFMLAASAQAGFPLDYLPENHPLQQRIRERMEDWGGTKDLQVAVDGCGVPTFHAPLPSMARTFARLAREMRDPGSLAGRIGRAMAIHPWLVSGDGRLDLAVTRAATEPLACKVGAEALFCIAIPGRDLGIAIKCHTGNDAALAIAVRAVCEAIDPGLLAATDWPWHLVKNWEGLVVGERLAVWA
jgi:L-asparaginase II